MAEKIILKFVQFTGTILSYLFIIIIDLSMQIKKLETVVMNIQ